MNAGTGLDLFPDSFFQLEQPASIGLALFRRMTGHGLFRYDRF